MSDIDRDELRRLLEEAETPWTIEQTTPSMGGPNWLIRRECKAGIIISAHEYGFYERGRLIVAAANALPPAGRAGCRMGRDRAGAGDAHPRRFVVRVRLLLALPDAPSARRG